MAWLILSLKTKTSKGSANLSVLNIMIKNVNWRSLLIKLCKRQSVIRSSSKLSNWIYRYCIVIKTRLLSLSVKDKSQEDLYKLKIWFDYYQLRSILTKPSHVTVIHNLHDNLISKTQKKNIISRTYSIKYRSTFELMKRKHYKVDKKTEIRFVHFKFLKQTLKYFVRITTTLEHRVETTSTTSFNVIQKRIVKLIYNKNIR